MKCHLPFFYATRTTRFSDQVETCDEKWLLYDNRRRSAQWLDADEAPRHFPKPELRQKMVMLTVWWSATGLIHYSFLNAGETITTKYCQQMDENASENSTTPSISQEKKPNSPPRQCPTARS